MPFDAAYLILLIPVVLNILAMLAYRGNYRRGATLVSPIIVLACAADMYSASQHGNLTGLITILVGGPMLVVLLLMGIGTLLDGLVRKASAPDVNAIRESDARVLRATISGGVFGSILGGFFLGGPGQFLINFFATRAFGVPSFGLWSWAIGGVFGLIVGTIVGWVRGRTPRA